MSTLRNLFLILCGVLIVTDAIAAPSASRSTGTAPLSVVFTADAPASSPTERRFHNNYYSWNFGDSTSGTWGTDGKSRNVDSGPVAAHVYESPGVYTATLTTVAYGGGTTQETFTVTVDDPDATFSGTNTICVSDATSNDFTGCPTGAQNIATNTLSLTTLLTTGKRVLLRRGSTWSSATEILNGGTVSDAQVGAYGTCSTPDGYGICSNAPVVQFTSTSTSMLDMKYKNGLVIWGISWSAAISTNAAGSLMVGSANLSDILFYKNKIRGFYSGISWGHVQSETYQTWPIEMSVVSNDIEDVGGYALYGGGENLNIAGNMFKNSSTTHLSRVWWAYRGVYNHNMASGGSLYEASPGADLKLHGPKYTDSQDIVSFPEKTRQVGTFAEVGEGALPYNTQYVVISDNVFGGPGTRVVDIYPQDVYSDERLYDIIFERNRIIQDYNGTDDFTFYQPIMSLGYYITHRNNIIDASFANGTAPALMMLTVDYFDFMPTTTGTELYNNPFYSDDSNLVNKAIGIQVNAGATGTIARNNYVSFPNGIGPKNAVLDLFGNTEVSKNVLTNTPYFTDPDNINPLLRDFTLTSLAIAEAIDKGDTVPVLEDFTGTARTGTFDIGAFEYGASAGPTCSDLTQNGDETGVDCGGSCPACDEPTVGAVHLLRLSDGVFSIMVD